MKFLPNFTEFACGAPLSFCLFAKRALLLVLLQKVISYPFDSFACGNLELHATQILFCNTAGRTKNSVKI